MKISVIILAGGSGERMGDGKNKIFRELNGKIVLERSVYPFQKNPLVSDILIVSHKNYVDEVNRSMASCSFDKVRPAIVGGSRRQDSFYNGLITIQKMNLNPDYVLSHDGDRPLVTQAELSAVINGMKVHGAAVVGHPVTDTIKMVGIKGQVVKTLNKKNLLAVQTPQGMKFKWALKAFQNVIDKNLQITDDVEALELSGYVVVVVPGSPDNIKIIVEEDMARASVILKKVKN